MHDQFEWERTKIESDWIQDWVRILCNMTESIMAEFKWEWMSLSQIELVWVRFRMEWECFLSESDRRYQGVWIQDGSVWIQYGRIQDGCHLQVESERVQNVNPRFSRLPSSSWVRINKMAESKIAAFKVPAIINLSENEWVWNVQIDGLPS